MFDHDISRSFEDQRFISEIENALANDLRLAGIFVDIMWHSQSSDHYTFRFEQSAMAVDFEAIKEVLNQDNTESSQYGISNPYMDGADLVVRVMRKQPGPIYGADGVW